MALLLLRSIVHAHTCPEESSRLRTLRHRRFHQGLLWNVHCIATVVLRKQLNFKSAVIRSNRSSCSIPILSSAFFHLPSTTTGLHFTGTRKKEPDYSVMIIMQFF